MREALSDWRLRRRIETLETEELRRLVREGIESGPGLYPSRADLASGLRTAVHGRYLVLYRERPEAGSVRVERVLHSARNIPRLI